jgi:hypothetical protein
VTGVISRQPLWEATDPISDGLQRFRQHNVGRTGLIAGGLAFSVALLLASIQHPSTTIDLVKPKTGLSQGDSTATELSDLPNLPSGAVSSLATILIDRFQESSSHESADVRQFLDFVQRKFPNVMPALAAAAAIAPQLAFEPPHTALAPAGGGGGGAPPDALTVPITGLPAWWDIWAWMDVPSGPVIQNSPNVELPPMIPSPATAAPVTAAPVSAAPVSAAPVSAAPVAAAPVSAAPTSPTALSPPPARPPQPPRADERVTVAQPTGASEGASPRTSDGSSGGSTNAGSDGSSGRGSSAASANGSGSVSSQPIKPTHAPKKPKPASAGGSGAGSSANSAGAQPGPRSSEGD